MTYEELIKRLERVRDVPAKETSFERVRSALDSLAIEFPPGGRGVVLIAGTNGKGSVAKTLETLIAASGKSVGLFTSPHMMETTERIRSHGRDLSKEEFIAAFGSIEPTADRYALSHFEILTLMMAEVFFGGRVRPRVERAVIEVGVGGRLDPTRLIPHETSVITRLGLDHQDLLGGSLREIATEKFGIVDRGNLVVHAPLPPEATEAARAVAERHDSRWVEAAIFLHHVEVRDGRPQWIMDTPWGAAPLALLGARSVENASIALTVLKERGEDVRALLPALSRIEWPCRMEGFPLEKKRVYLSGDHNPQGVASLEEIVSRFRYEKLHLVLGIGRNKDASSMIESFSKFRGAELYLTLTPFRAASLDVYGSWLGRAAFSSDSPERALRKALENATERDLVLVSGSLYLVGTLRKRLIEGAFGPHSRE